MATSTNPAELLDVWNGWHTISPPMRKDFTRFVELANKGARELGFKDTGAMWRSKYDMPPDDFARSSTGCGSRCGRSTSRCTPTCATKLREKYGDAGARQRARFRRICSATCGRRSGTTSTRWSRPPTPTPATT